MALGKERGGEFGTRQTLVTKSHKKWYKSPGEDPRRKGARHGGQTSLCASWRPSCAMQSQMCSPDVQPLELELRD